MALIISAMKDIPRIHLQYQKITDSDWVRKKKDLSMPHDHDFMLYFY